jgi:hypothetical protein
MNSRRRVNSTVRRNPPVMIFAHKVVVLFLLVLAAHLSPANAQSPTKISVAIPGTNKYTRKEMRVHRFLWTNWQRRRNATAEVTFFGIDAGNVYTVYLKKDSGGRWIVEEYMRHYQAVGPGSTDDTLVASGIAIRRFRLRSGAFVVRIVTGDGKTVSLFD